MKLQSIAWALCATTLVLAGCGAGGVSPTGGQAAAPGAPFSKHKASAIVVSPSSLSFTSSGAHHAIAVSETGYKGKFTAAAAKTCANVATVKAAASGKKFTVTSGQKAGKKCTLKVSDKNGNSASVKVIVTLTIGHIH